MVGDELAGGDVRATAVEGRRWTRARPSATVEPHKMRAGVAEDVSDQMAMAGEPDDNQPVGE
jgi:hypothetical protein